MSGDLAGRANHEFVRCLRSIRWLFLLLAWVWTDGLAQLAMAAAASQRSGQGVRAADLNFARPGKVGFTLLPPELASSSPTLSAIGPAPRIAF